MMELNKAPKEIFRIFFLNFIFGFFFKAVNSLYCISNLVTPYAPSRALRSSNERFFLVFCGLILNPRVMELLLSLVLNYGIVSDLLPV